MSVENKNTNEALYNSPDLKSMFENGDFEGALNRFAQKSGETVNDRVEEISGRVEIATVLESYNEKDTLGLANIFNKAFNIQNGEFQALA